MGTAVGQGKQRVFVGGTSVMDEVWSWDEGDGAERDHHEHDSVGTVDVQILLSWFFETADPAEIAYDARERAA
jgi:hypothetical protein